jgi:hypothetical protein
MDGDKDNNAPWNLRYGTQAEQERDKRHAGRAGNRGKRLNGSENKDQEGIGHQASGGRRGD